MSLTNFRGINRSVDCEAVSYVEEEVNDVAVVHDVGFSFGPHFSGGLDGGFGFVLFEVFEGVDFSADEAAFEVSVDNAGGLRRSSADGNGPGADFLGAG